MSIETSTRVDLGGTAFDRVTAPEVVAVVRDAIARGRGGRIVTPNVDILRQAQVDAGVRALLRDADLVVADGMPLVWASRLGGDPLPERVAGSDLIWSLSAGLGRDHRSVFVVGGRPAVPATRAPVTGSPAVRALPDGAARAAGRLAAASPGLRIAGTECPPHGFQRDAASFAAFCRRVAEARPDMVFVGLGFPKQEQVITRLREHLPRAWFIGCGAAVDFVAGDVDRAPAWMRRTGLEWAHRLGREPGRLAGRYLRHDAPYALRLLASAATRH